MIKKIIKSEKLKKTLLVILMITMMSTINPVVSNAGMAMSVLTKPISSLVMGCLDAVNALLTTLFAPETKYKEAISKLGDINKSADSKGWYEKLADGFDDLRDTYYNFLLSPEDIFSGEIQVTNANIFSSDFDKNGKINSSDWNLFNHLMKQLKQATAGLYYITRNLAVVILLCLLIYTGIRIVMASKSADEKAKWKEHLYDWIKALALVMFVHLIMIGIFYISDVITNGLRGAFGGDSIVAHIRSNFDDSSALDVISSIVYIVMYGYVTYITIVFLLSYFKRLFYIIVMVTVAPVISSLYALGKTGKERFNRWFKEFTMGVMVQPFQLLIYSILFLIPMKVMTSGDTEIGTGAFKVTFGTLDTQIFALIAMSMIRPIEKFMRNIFGFTGTALDNVASFESGKRTLDKGAEFGKQVVKTGIMVGGALATGGASLGMSSLSGVGQSSTQNFLQDTPLGNIMNNPTGGIGLEEESEQIPLSDIINNPTGGINSNNNNIQSSETDKGINKEQFASSQKQVAGLDNYKPTTELDNDKSNANMVLDNANVQINNAKGLEIGNSAGMGISNNEAIKLDEKNGPEKEQEKTESKKEEKTESNKEEKPRIGEQDLSTALLNKLGIGFARRLEAPQKIASKLGEKNPKLKDLSESRLLQVGSNLSAKLNLENLSESLLTDPGMLEQFENLRQSAHGFTDTLYVDSAGSGGDWKNNLTAEFIKEQKDQNEFNFVNNSGNIKDAIKLFGIDKKTDDKDRPLKPDKQEELAREKLKTMAPYSAIGIKDIGTIKVLMDRGVKPEKALQTLKKENKGTMNYNKFVENQENIQIMQKIEAEKMGKLSEFRAGNQTVIQQVNQQVQQTISNGAQYISSGDAKDPETLNRLVELERKLDSKVSIEGSKHYSKSQYVVGIDKVIQKAVKDNVKTIKLPVNKAMPINDTIRQKNNKAEISTKALESAMNDVLKERRMQQAGTRTTKIVNPSDGTTTKTMNTSSRLRTTKTNNTTTTKRMPPGNSPK